MPGVPVNRQRKYVMDAQGNVYLNPRMSGRFVEPLVALVRPTPTETRDALLRLRSGLGLSRSQLACALNVSNDVLRRWETGERQPSGSARQLIRFVELVVFSPASIGKEFGGMFIGSVDMAAASRVRAEVLARAGVDEANA